MYTFTKAYTYGDSGQLLAFTQNGKKYFYHYNAHGDVIAISDSTGKTVAKYQYDTWGNPTKTEASDEVKDNRYRYAGYQYDEETGLYYLMARYYEPRNGVFLSLDPDPGSDGDSLDQNGYAYGNNNPVMNVDPDGHWARYLWEVVKRSWNGAPGKWVKRNVGKGYNASKKWTKSIIKKGAKRIAKKIPYRIHKVGRIKGDKEKGRGYWGVIYSKKKKTGRSIYRSLEWHTPHNNHGYHLQSNKFSRYKGKWKRGSAQWRLTVYKR
ncbi:hypothetical protein BSB_26620 [Bacillus stercoris]|nr:WapA [Bacillus sp. JS]BEV39589.1 hypothetical protein BSB_26620 [Bacillus stercoris]GFM12305.1 WapA [Bacillus sp. FW1]